jgi:hypothetical protein
MAKIGGLTNLTKLVKTPNLTIFRHFSDPLFSLQGRLETPLFPEMAKKCQKMGVWVNALETWEFSKNGQISQISRNLTKFDLFS